MLGVDRPCISLKPEAGVENPTASLSEAILRVVLGVRQPGDLSPCSPVLIRFPDDANPKSLRSDSFRFIGNKIGVLQTDSVSGLLFCKDSGGASKGFGDAVDCFKLPKGFFNGSCSESKNCD